MRLLADNRAGVFVLAHPSHGRRIASGHILIQYSGENS
jgi:hypothetical protein